MKIGRWSVGARVLAFAASLLFAAQASAQNDPLPSWNEDAAKQAIVWFVQTTTTAGSPQFVPPGERIATFDENDGATFAVGQQVHFCPGPVGGTEWNTPGFDPTRNLIVTGTVDWCDTVKIQDDKKLASVAVDQPFTGAAYLNPINMFGKESRTDGHWAGWIYASDADTGVWKWRAKSNYPIVAAITPTAGGVVFFGDLGGNLYALDSATGQKLWSQVLRAGVGIGGGVITYTVGGMQKVAVADGFTMVAWPTKPATAKVVILGLEGDSEKK